MGHPRNIQITGAGSRVDSTTCTCYCI